MDEPSTSAQFVYRLATPEEWAEAQTSGVVPLREIDEKDGYVHLSTHKQALETARIHFSEAPALLALEIPLMVIAADVKFERAPKRGEDFPHLYGRLRAEHVARAISLTRASDGFHFGDTI